MNISTTVGVSGFLKNAGGTIKRLSTSPGFIVFAIGKIAAGLIMNVARGAGGRFYFAEHYRDINVDTNFSIWVMAGAGMAAVASGINAIITWKKVPLKYIGLLNVTLMGK